MLIAKIFVNHDQIDEVWIQNTGKLFDRPDYYLYRIRKPEIDHVDIVHKRSDGWETLLISALKELRINK